MWLAVRVWRQAPAGQGRLPGAAGGHFDEDDEDEDDDEAANEDSRSSGGSGSEDGSGDSDATEDMSFRCFKSWLAPYVF